MKKTMLILIIIPMLFLLFSCSATENDGKLTVAVGVVPESAFVKKVAGDIVDTVVLVPPGNSPTNYQPTAKEMQALSKASIYFTLQMPTEAANILPKVKNFNKDIIIVNLRDAVSAVYPLRMISGHDDEDNNGKADELSVDPHLWLSPKRTVVMVQVIADELSKIDESNRDTYQANASAYIEDIISMDEELKIRIDALKNKSFMIYHGSYGYFAEDYGLDMISIEAEGKQATAIEIQKVIEHALEDGIKIIFYQDEFDDNQAQTVAEEIGGKVVKSSPLSENYIQSLMEFVYALEERED